MTKQTLHSVDSSKMKSKHFRHLDKDLEPCLHAKTVSLSQSSHLTCLRLLLGGLNLLD